MPKTTSICGPGYAAHQRQKRAMRWFRSVPRTEARLEARRVEREIIEATRRPFGRQGAK